MKTILSNLKGATLFLFVLMIVFYVIEMFVVGPQAVGLSADNMGYLYPWLTHHLAHGNILHLVMNMLMLIMLGGMLQERIGSANLLKSTGMLMVFTSLGSYYHISQGPENALVLGFSGVLFGWVAMLHYSAPRKALWTDFIMLSLFHIGLPMAGINLAWAMHLAGYLFGLGYVHYLVRQGYDMNLFRQEPVQRKARYQPVEWEG